jgi:zinc D-Ala-D-Ala carboxypeptidase
MLATLLTLAFVGAACGPAPIQPTPSPLRSAEASASSTPTPTPDHEAPAIVAQDPPPGGVIATTGSLRVTFSEPVSGVDAARFQLRDAAEGIVAATVTLDPQRRIATLAPNVGLTVAATYTATLAGAVRDGAGNPLAPVSWSLTAANDVSFAAGTYTGYRFDDTSAHLTAIKRATLGAPSSASAGEYRMVDGQGYLLIDAGIWEGYLVHGEPWGLAQDDRAAPITPLPACDHLDLPTARGASADWATTLLDTLFQLPSGYAPPDLVNTATAGLGAGHVIRSIAVDDLSAMVAAASADGAHLAIQSAYRSFAGQVVTFNSWVRRVGTKAALQTSARPGHSEHQLGTTIDFRSVNGPAPWSFADWAATTEGAWLAANAWRFGWVMSYPRGAIGVSCYRYEPWHYRYVGRDAAAAIHADGVTLREWLWDKGYGIR